jgi:hypothetical protein
MTRIFEVLSHGLRDYLIPFSDVTILWGCIKWAKILSRANLDISVTLSNLLRGYLTWPMRLSHSQPRPYQSQESCYREHIICSHNQESSWDLSTFQDREGWWDRHLSELTFDGNLGGREFISLYMREGKVSLLRLQTSLNQGDEF